MKFTSLKIEQRLIEQAIDINCCSVSPSSIVVSVWVLLFGEHLLYEKGFEERVNIV